MVKTFEPAIRIVIKNKRKWLLRLNQKVMEMGRAALHSAPVIRKSPGREQAPNPAYFTDGTWKPRIAPFGESRLQGLSMAVRAWDVGKSECRAVMVRIRVETSPGTKVSRRPTGLPSQESMLNRYDGEEQMTTSAMPLIGASPNVASEQRVKRRQTSIAKAIWRR